MAIRPVEKGGPEAFVGPHHVTSYADGQGFAAGAYALEQQRKTQQEEQRKAQMQRQRQQKQCRPGFSEE